MLKNVMRVVLAALALAGMVVSYLALRVHTMDPAESPPCAVTERFDCGTVNHSRYAVFPARTFDEAPGTKHIPVAAVGIAGYALMIALALAARFRILLAMAVGGFAVACYLTYLEANVIHKWCIYCLWSQGIVTVLLLGTVWAVAAGRSRTMLRA